MTKVIDQTSFDPLAEARMEIVGLKLTVQVLLTFTALQIANNKEDGAIKELKSIQKLIERGIDHLDFSQPSLADEWREGIRASVASLFEKFGKD